MGHYDDVRYFEEARHDGFSDKELLSLEEEVKEKGEIIVYDDYIGMRKILMANKSNILSSRGSGSSRHIYYDPDKMQRVAKGLLNDWKRSIWCNIRRFG